MTACGRFPHRISAVGRVAGVLALFAWTAGLAADWNPLANDGVHDPDNPALPLLQEPAEALATVIAAASPS